MPQLRYRLDFTEEPLRKPLEARQYYITRRKNLPSTNVPVAVIFYTLSLGEDHIR